MKLPALSSLVSIAALAIACFILQPTAAAQSDPNQAQMVDLLGRVQNLDYSVQMQSNVIGNTPYLNGEIDALIPIWDYVYDEVYNPTGYNLWDVQDYVNTICTVAMTYYYSTYDPYYYGMIQACNSVIYWVDYEMSQPGVTP